MAKTEKTYIRDAKVVEAFGKNLAKYRRQKGLSQKQLSEIADVDISQISRMERGVITPTIPTAYVLAGALGITLCKLVTFDI